MFPIGNYFQLWGQQLQAGCKTHSSGNNPLFLLQSGGSLKEKESWL